MMRFRFVLLSLVTTVAACGGDSSSTETTRVDHLPPKIELPVKEPGFGGVAGASDNAPVVENIAKPELPAVETFIPTKLSECMSLGKDAAAKGNHKRARELFEAAIKLDRKSALPHIELARSFIATNERALAIRHAGKGVKLAPESSYAYNTLGRAELLRHDYDGAELAFRQATELDADNVWAWNNLGLVYLTQKNYQEAVNALVEATSRKGTEGYMWNNLGTAYEQLDRLDEARDAFDSGAKLGSVAAKASRKRLEGVESIAVVANKPSKTDESFETREPMPEVEEEEEPVVEDVVIDEHHDDDLPVVDDEPKPEPDVEDIKGEAVDDNKDEAKVDDTKVDDDKAEPDAKKDEPKKDEPKADPKPSTT